MRRFGSSRRPASCTTTLAMRGRPVRCTLMNEILLRPTIYRVLGSWQPPLPSPSHPLPLYPLPHPILPTLALPGACPPTACPSGPCCCRWLARWCQPLRAECLSVRGVCALCVCLSLVSVRPFCSPLSRALSRSVCGGGLVCVCVRSPVCMLSFRYIIMQRALFNTQQDFWDLFQLLPHAEL